ncbi:carbohydrate ABC transporter permease [Staphylococcus pseudintermedius]
MKKQHIVYLALYIVVILLTVIAVFPFLWIILSSFKSTNELANHPLSLISKEFTIEYYKQVLFDLGFIKNIRNSLIISLVATLISIVVSALGAYGIVRFFPSFGKIDDTISNYDVYVSTHFVSDSLHNCHCTVRINEYLDRSCYYISIFLDSLCSVDAHRFFSTVPIEIEEAAKVDGANRLVIFSKIVLPIVMPGLVATAVYTFINTWNEFLFALLLINTTNKMPISIALYSLNGSEILNWGQMLAASVIIVLPSILFLC